MKKVIYNLVMVTVLSLSTAVTAQVGISANNEDPKATLDVLALKKADVADGILIPRISKDYAQNMHKPEVSTLVYVNDVSGTGGDRTTEVTIDGFYYFDGTRWKKISESNPREIGAVYEKVRVFRGATFSVSDIQPDDYIIAFTDAEGFAMPTITDEYKNRTICIRNSTTAPFGTGAKQVIITNVVAGAETINANLTRCYTSFQDTDKQWYWISTSF